MFIKLYCRFFFLNEFANKYSSRKLIVVVLGLFVGGSLGSLFVCGVGFVSITSNVLLSEVRSGLFLISSFCGGS